MACQGRQLGWKNHNWRWMWMGCHFLLENKKQIWMELLVLTYIFAKHPPKGTLVNSLDSDLQHQISVYTVCIK